MIAIIFQTIEYSYHNLEELFVHAKEISQKENINANSKLYVVNDEIVFKMYLPETKEYLRNLNNLFIIREIQELKKIEELVLPTALIKLNKNVIGYFMPYIKGKSLCNYLLDLSVDNKQKLYVFTQLAKVIEWLPSGIHIGDLHANNIIVDQHNKIHLIDIDGFSIDGGEQLSVPTPLPYVVGKYCNREGHPIISKNSDIYCVFQLFLRYILQGFDIMDSEYMGKYISFLKYIEGCELLIKELELLYCLDDNVLDVETFVNLSVDKISLNVFWEKSNLKTKNRIASYILKNFWEEHDGKIF